MSQRKNDLLNAARLLAGTDTTVRQLGHHFPAEYVQPAEVLTAIQAGEATWAVEFPNERTPYAGSCATRQPLSIFPEPRTENARRRMEQAERDYHRALELQA